MDDATLGSDLVGGGGFRGGLRGRIGYPDAARADSFGCRSVGGNAAAHGHCNAYAATGHRNASADYNADADCYPGADCNADADHYPGADCYPGTDADAHAGANRNPGADAPAG